MKKIIVIDGGPRKNFNTASMLQKFAEGASSVSDQLTEQREPSNSLEWPSRNGSRRSQIEVKTVRLYSLDYKGCMSCMACKIKSKASEIKWRWLRQRFMYYERVRSGYRLICLLVATIAVLSKHRD